MRFYFVLMTLLSTSMSFSQMRPIEKIYVVEGVVADRETLKSITSAILYNDSLGIMTTSDEKGYFKLVVPAQLLMDREIIFIDIVKTGYKRNGSGFTYNPSQADTIQINKGERTIWNNGIKIFWMAKNESALSSTNGAYARTKEGLYNAASVQQTFQNTVTFEKLNRKMETLKQGNERVFFLINGKAAMATATYDMYFDDASPIVFINRKRVKLSDINSQLKRSEARVDTPTSNALSKQYGKDVIAFTFNN